MMVQKGMRFQHVIVRVNRSLIIVLNVVIIIVAIGTAGDTRSETNNKEK